MPFGGGRRLKDKSDNRDTKIVPSAVVARRELL